jgi:hypothetical protein
MTCQFPQSSEPRTQSVLLITDNKHKGLRKAQMASVYVIYSTARYLFLTILEAGKSKIKVSLLGEGVLFVSLCDSMQKSQWGQIVCPSW